MTSTPPGLFQTLIDRIHDRIGGKPLDSNCTEWPGALNRGYGRIGIKRNGEQFSFYTHRLLYEAHVGPIPDGHEVHHHCENRSCCNPEHFILIDGHEHRRQFHAPLVRARGVACPRCGADRWKQRYRNGRLNGNRCADCHARATRNRKGKQ